MFSISFNVYNIKENNNIEIDELFLTEEGINDVRYNIDHGGFLPLIKKFENLDDAIKVIENIQNKEVYSSIFVYDSKEFYTNDNKGLVYYKWARDTYPKKEDLIIEIKKLCENYSPQIRVEENLYSYFTTDISLYQGEVCLASYVSIIDDCSQTPYTQKINEFLQMTKNKTAKEAAILFLEKYTKDLPFKPVDQEDIREDFKDKFNLIINILRKNNIEYVTHTAPKNGTLYIEYLNKKIRIGDNLHPYFNGLDIYADIICFERLHVAEEDGDVYYTAEKRNIHVDYSDALITYLIEKSIRKSTKQPKEHKEYRLNRETLINETYNEYNQTKRGTCSFHGIISFI